MKDPNLYRPCVGIVLFKAGSGIWSGKRIGHFNHAWQMPQGGIDENENPRTAALRELQEETSVTSAKIIDQTSDWIYYDLPKDVVPNFWGGKYLGQRQIWFLMEFTGNESEINIETTEPEFSNWAWENPQFLLDNGIEFKREVYEKVFNKWQNFIEPTKA